MFAYTNYKLHFNTTNSTGVTIILLFYSAVDCCEVWGLVVEYGASIVTGKQIGRAHV